MSFVGLVPATVPRYVIFVGLDHPTGADTSGGKVWAPVCSRIATRALGQ